MESKQAAFENLINQHIRLIYKVAGNYFFDEESRADVAQEIMLQLWRSYDRYDDRFAPTTWIYKVALNTAISFVRKASSRPKLETNMEQAVFEFQEAAHQSTDQDIETIMQSLNKFERAVVLLHLDGLNYEQIGEALSLSATNVGSRLSRIKKKLNQTVKRSH